MIEALLHGKLSREQENMEDLLTSMVFGTLKYLGPESLGAFISMARTPEETYPMRHLKQARRAFFEFWPSLREESCTSCEPDVLLTVEDADGHETRVLVEAKFRSGKSSFADINEDPTQETLLKHRATTDQLAKEWENLSARGSSNAVVLYVTAELSMPRTDIEEAQNELRAKHKPPGLFCWLSWSSLHDLADTLADMPQKDMLKELLSALERLSLVPFRAFPRADLPRLSWSFDAAPSLAFEVPQVPLPPWSFGTTVDTQWNWPVHSTSMSPWRFEP